MILIVWDTVGDGRDLGYWHGDGWTVLIGAAREYQSRDEADRDLRAARETVQRGSQRGSVEVQELS